MPLSLKPVSPAQGMHWVRQGVRLFLRHPLGFSALFAGYLMLMVVVALVPVVGGWVTLASLPLLSLGFMVASEEALAGRRVHLGHCLTPLRRDATRRKSQGVLCVAYGVASVVVMLAADGIDGGSFEKLQQLLASSGKTAQIDALLAQPEFAWGMWTRVIGAVLVAIPFWHASALVHWGGQRPAQALFSSTLAVWRAKAAFVTYFLTWALLAAAFGLLVALLLSLLGQSQMAAAVALPGALTLSTIFYVSLIFIFQDSFDTRARVVSA